MHTTLFALTVVASLFAPAAFQVTVTGQGRPMILIPGLSAGPETWDGTVGHFKDRYEMHVLTVAGFAGVPRVEAPMLDRVVDDLAAYIMDRGLEKPVLVGHSLGGVLALRLAIKYPELTGPIIDVDGYPDYVTLTGMNRQSGPGANIGALIRQGMLGLTQEAYEAFVRGGASTRPMVSRDSDFATLVKWGLASDRTAVAEAMAELYALDLRPELARITSRTLVLAAWQSYAAYTNHDRHMAVLRDQFRQLAGVRVELNDSARHFIMWDDPRWMLDLMDRFLAGR